MAHICNVAGGKCGGKEHTAQATLNGEGDIDAVIKAATEFAVLKLGVAS
ncbi:unnamed protein product [Soboliphyme baturini]|uniref:DHHA1 domain-containing protein n=1 Tax=Soboliphyme baturini TaxID=241478 RepID=A0A183IPR2_9BILA|nr:unnamed protein product [Soboliphyme baturini]